MCGSLFIRTPACALMLRRCVFSSIRQKGKAVLSACDQWEVCEVMLWNLHRRSVVRQYAQVRVTPPLTFSFRRHMTHGTWSSVDDKFQSSPVPLPCFSLPTCPLSAESLSVFGLYPCTGLLALGRSSSHTQTHVHTHHRALVSVTQGV